jgi:acetolactate synthase-1/2/3 large subunit
MYTVARLLAETLIKLGIPRVYGVIGTSVLDFVDALYELRTSISYVTVRHEQAAVSAADGEARVSARPSAALLHAGPGLLNAMIGLGIAYRDRSPVLVIVGGVRRRLRGSEAWLEVDVESVTKPVAKQYSYISSASEAADRLVEVFETLYRKPWAPVVLEVAEDVWRETLDVDERYWAKLVEALKASTGGSASFRELLEILDILVSAKKPLIMVCGEAAYSPHFSQEDLMVLAERLDAYIVTSGNARGACPEDHPRCLGRLGFGGGNIVADKAFEESDAVLVLGGEFDDLHTYGYTMLPAGDIILVSEDPAVEKRPPYYTRWLKADPARTLNSLAKLATERGVAIERPEWRKLVDEFRRRWDAVVSEALSRRYEAAVNPARVLKMIDSMLPRKRVVAAGQGMHLVYAYDFIKVYEPRSFLAATQLGAMSFALPSAIGASYVAGSKPVIAVVGDGELMMVVQELETITRERRNVKIVLLNDNSYRVLYLRQLIQKQGRIYGTILGNPDFIQLARAFRIDATRVSSEGEVESKVRVFLEAKGPALLEIVTPRDDVPPMNIEYALRM